MPTKRRRTTAAAAKTTRFVLMAVIGAVMLSVTLYFTTTLLQRRQSAVVGAATGAAELSLTPASGVLPADGMVTIMATTDKQLGFVAAHLTFDPTQIKLSQEITLPTGAFKRTIRLTTMAEANASGQIYVVLGIDPTTRTTAPTGSFPIAQLKFAPKTATANTLTSLAFNSGSLQMVDLNAVPFSISAKGSSLTINPVVPATPQPTTVVKNAGPVITIKSPAQNSVIPKNGVWVGSEVSDPDGIFTTKFYFDNVLIKTCPKNQMVCNYTYRGKVTPGKHTIRVEAVDNSAVKNTSHTIINVSK